MRKYLMPAATALMTVGAIIFGVCCSSPTTRDTLAREATSCIPPAAAAFAACGKGDSVCFATASATLALCIVTNARPPAPPAPPAPSPVVPSSGGSNAPVKLALASWDSPTVVAMDIAVYWSDGTVHHAELYAGDLIISPNASDPDYEWFADAVANAAVPSPVVPSSSGSNAPVKLALASWDSPTVVAMPSCTQATSSSARTPRTPTMSGSPTR